MSQTKVMITTIKCDRCGASASGDDSGNIFTRAWAHGSAQYFNGMPALQDYNFELCPTCVGSLRTWWRNDARTSST